MGNACASQHILDGIADGGEEAFEERFSLGARLGCGTFGDVKIVHDRANQNNYACKTLRKGYRYVCEDFELQAPLDTKMIRSEVRILQVLQGQHSSLELVAVYETHGLVHIITECCSGGEMLEYVANLKEDLSVSDVSRIAYQLFDAVAHCVRNHVIHRDIKPENTMFVTPKPGADLRLIDFGVSTFDKDRPKNKLHRTLAGTAFYSAPEMIRRSYDCKVDVWSAALTIYVLVSGYPMANLHETFDLLHQEYDRNLQELPGHHENFPKSYFQFLNDAMVYNYRKRQSAAKILKTSSFLKLYLNGTPKSTTIKGSISRHNATLNFRAFEQALTALLATQLRRDEVHDLFKLCCTHHDVKELSLVKVSEIKQTLRDEMLFDRVVNQINKLSDADLYDGFWYHVHLLQDNGHKNKAIRNQQLESSEDYPSTSRDPVKDVAIPECPQ